MLLLLAGMVALTAFLWLRSAVPISEGLEQGSGQWFLPAVQAPSLSASPTAVFTESLNPTPVPSPTTIVIDPVGSPAGREPTPLPIKTTIPVTPTAVLITPTSSLCSLPIDWQAYTIQRGDTLYSLARQRGTTTTAVKAANCLQDNLIVTGQQIFLPGIPLVVSPTPNLVNTPQPETIRVKATD
ncbi:MAG: LysM peptidoglycan-binding domain-containing protein [Anaerolineae bacterium]